MIVDTGSSNTAFPCSQCDRCGRDFHVDEPFLQELSITFRKETCQDCALGTCQGGECRFGISYLEGSSWSAVESVDRCYLGGFHNEAVPSSFHWFKNGRDPHAAREFAFDLSFGCQTEVSGDFTHQLADGIMGMNVGPAAVFDQMFVQDKIHSRAFSLCFQRSRLTRRSGTESGVMTLGGSDTKLHRQAMAFTPLEPGAFYSIQLRKFYLVRGERDQEGATSVPIAVPEALNQYDRKHVIIDSGTTDTYFTHEMREDFHKAWLSIVGLPFSNDPKSMSEEEIEKLPTLVLQFKGADENEHIIGLGSTPLAGALDPTYPFDLVVTIPPSHYMEFHPDKEGYVAGIFWDESEGIVLGANTMMGHDILFDVENARIGWAESYCNYTEVAERFIRTSENIYKSPSLRTRTPPIGLTNNSKVFRNNHLMVILVAVLVMISALLGSLVFLIKRYSRNHSRVARRPSSLSPALSVGREVKRRSTQRSASEMTVPAVRHLRRNESRSLLQAVQELDENNQKAVRSPPSQMPSRMFSKRTGLLRLEESSKSFPRSPPRHMSSQMVSQRAGLLRSRSQQVERDASKVSLL